MAEKFKLPVFTFVDTPGAFPGIDAEERGQSEAIGRNIYEMAQLEVPIIVTIIGEGGSGGALAISVGDQVLMLQFSVYSVISPENCSTILWRTWDFKEKAAEALKLTATDMFKNGLVDGVIPEPLGGAHADHEEACRLVKEVVTKELEKLVKVDPAKRVEKRIAKFCKMGVVVKAR